jgi:hypothetical protein
VFANSVAAVRSNAQWTLTSELGQSGGVENRTRRSGTDAGTRGAANDGLQ